MEITQLEAFVAVVEEKSFSRAAVRMLRTQPAVSQAVHRLEEWAGEPLLDRSSKSGVLTASGRLFYDYAKKVLNLREEARSALAELRALESGKVTIGANESTALYLLPVLKRFRQRHPRVQVAVKRSLSREIPSALLRYEIDLGVLSYNPQNPDLESAVVSVDELCLIVPREPSVWPAPPGSAFANSGRSSSSRTTYLRLTGSASSKPSPATIRRSRSRRSCPPLRPSRNLSAWGWASPSFRACASRKSWRGRNSSPCP